MVGRPILTVQPPVAGEGCLDSQRIRIVRSDGQTAGWLTHANPLAESNAGGMAGEFEIASGCSLVTWSGTLGGSLFDAEPRNWMGAGKESLRRVVEQVTPILKVHGMTWLIRPHCRHVLNDVHGVRRFFQECDESQVQLCLEPSALLEDRMIPNIDDHLERIFEGLGPIAQWILVSDVDATPGQDLPRPCEAGKGRIDWAHFRRLLDCSTSESTPIMVRPTLGEDSFEMARRLGLI